MQESIICEKVECPKCGQSLYILGIEDHIDNCRPKKHNIKIEEIEKDSQGNVDQKKVECKDCHEWILESKYEAHNRGHKYLRKKPFNYGILFDGQVNKVKSVSSKSLPKYEKFSNQQDETNFQDQDSQQLPKYEKFYFFDKLRQESQNQQEEQFNNFSFQNEDQNQLQEDKLYIQQQLQPLKIKQQQQQQQQELQFIYKKQQSDTLQDQQQNMQFNYKKQNTSINQELQNQKQSYEYLKFQSKKKEVQQEYQQQQLGLVQQQQNFQQQQKQNQQQQQQKQPQQQQQQQQKHQQHQQRQQNQQHQQKNKSNRNHFNNKHQYQQRQPRQDFQYKAPQIKQQNRVRNRSQNNMTDSQVWRMDDNQIYEYFTQLDLKQNKGFTENQLLKLKQYQLKNKQDECTICSDELDVGVDVIALPCTHIFHADCIKKWLIYRKTCPICLLEINP